MDRRGTGGTRLRRLRFGPVQFGWLIFHIDSGLYIGRRFISRPRWARTFEAAEKRRREIGTETTAEWEERTLREGAERRARGEDQHRTMDGVNMDDWVDLNDVSGI